MSEANCIVTTYWYQPWFAWAMTMCECGEEQRNFFGPRQWEEQLERFTNSTIGFVQHDFAEPDIIEAFTDLYRDKLTIPEARELTAEDRRLCDFFRYLLERGEMT